MPYRAFLFDPATGRRFRLGTVINTGVPPKPFEEHTGPRQHTERFEKNNADGWKDYGTPTRRENGRLIGGKGTLSILEGLTEADPMVSVDARNNAEAGVVLRFHDPNRYLVALYTPSLKALYLHDRKNGQWGSPLRRVDVPVIGTNLHLVAGACRGYAAAVLTDGNHTYSTPVISVSNTEPGRTGLWLYQIGDRQEFDNFEVSRAEFGPVVRAIPGLPAAAREAGPGEEPLVIHENPNIVPAVTLPEITELPGGDYQLPRLPAPQDWILVFTRLR